MLHFEGTWRFSSPRRIPSAVDDEFFGLITMMARGKQSVIESFKTRYAAAAGQQYSRSSGTGWAQSDLQSLMSSVAGNAPLFIEAFYDGMEMVKDQIEIPLPGLQVINGILEKHKSGFRIQPPDLLWVDKGVTPLQAPEIPLSFDQQAKEIIQKSLNEAERLLFENRERPAVQELLWLLETITMSFEGKTTDGTNTIEGKYFNRLIPALRKANKGRSIEQILGWIQTLHGFLSAPKGGRMRHGPDLKDGIVTSSTEAKLYYNLTLSYISYLMAEFDRIPND